MSSTDHDPGAVRTPSEHAWFVRLLIGLVCLFVATVLVLNAPDRVEDSEVPVDAQPHTVDVSPYSSTVLFVPDVADGPQCRVADPDDGSLLPTAPPSGSGNRYGDTPEGYTTLLVFTPSSDTVVVTCDGSTEPVVVAAENPGTPYLVARYGGATLLTVIAIALLASSARLVARRR